MIRAAPMRLLVTLGLIFALPAAAQTISNPSTGATTSATSATSGSMSAADKLKLDGIAPGATANTGTVTTVSVAASNGVTGTVSNATTSPAISLALGAITPTSITSSGAVAASAFTGPLVGNASTATALQTARAINGVAFDGTAAITISAVDATARPPVTRSLSTTAPLTGGGDLTADRTFGISAATTAAAGSMSAADKAKLDGVAVGATANTGTVTTVSVAASNGVTGTVSNATTSPAISLALGAITPTSITSSGTVAASAFTGPLVGNASTATALQTARAINGVAFDGTAAITISAVDATARPPASRSLSTTAPLTGGGDLTADRTFGISAATTAAAGSMSAADKAKLDGVAVGATANTGTVTSIATTVANGLIATVTNATTSPSIAISGANLTPTSLTASGAVSGSNLSGTNTGDQVNVTGNAGTATRLATARTIAGSSFDGTANITIADTALTGSAWTDFAPGISCGSGTLGSASLTNTRYKQIGKTMFVHWTVSITANGSCTNYVLVSAPAAAASATNGQWTWIGRENALTGKAVQAVLAAGTSNVAIYFMDNTYPGGTGALINVDGFYEVP